MAAVQRKGRVVRTLSAARTEAALPALRAYHGACACGSVRFRVEVDPKTAAPCICARCRGTGLKIATAALSDFRLLTGAEDLTEPLEDARTPHHFFCGRCGEPAFGYPNDSSVTVNVAFLDRGDPADLTGET